MQIQAITQPSGNVLGHLISGEVFSFEGTTYVRGTDLPRAETYGSDKPAPLTIHCTSLLDGYRHEFRYNIVVQHHSTALLVLKP